MKQTKIAAKIRRMKRKGFDGSKPVEPKFKRRWGSRPFPKRKMPWRDR